MSGSLCPVTTQDDPIAAEWLAVLSISRLAAALLALWSGNSASQAYITAQQQLMAACRHSVRQHTVHLQCKRVQLNMPMARPHPVLPQGCS